MAPSSDHPAAWPVTAVGERILFLDVDGVLNHVGGPLRPDVPGMAAWLDPQHLPPLNRVLLTTGARIVVSSSWRVGRSAQDMRQLFGDFGVLAPIIGVTPIYPAKTRADEIGAWLAARPGLVRPVVAYAIVDDELRIAEGPLAPRLVGTSKLHGLTDEHVAPLVRALSLPYPAPWLALDGSAALATEHPLAARAARAVARRSDREDILFELDDGGPAGPFAVTRGDAVSYYDTRWRLEAECLFPSSAGAR